MKRRRKEINIKVEDLDTGKISRANVIFGWYGDAQDVVDWIVDAIKALEEVEK